MLQIDNVSKTYGKHRAVDGVTLELGAGVIGLIGHNGAGKTTLMQMIATLSKPTSGRIAFDGTDIAKSPTRCAAGSAICRRTSASTRT